MPTSLSEDDVVLLARQAGLDLPAAYFQELVGAYAKVRQMIDAMPTGRPHGDEPAHIFVATKFLLEEA